MNTSSENQLERVIKALREVGSQGLTTIQLREELDIMMPGLVYMNCDITPTSIFSAWNHDTNAQGSRHSVGRYIFLPRQMEGRTTSLCKAIGAKCRECIFDPYSGVGAGGFFYLDYTPMHPPEWQPT